MPNFVKKIIDLVDKNVNEEIEIRTGEITADNGDGTYDVKISNADSATPDVETMYYNDIFSVGEIVDIGFEYGNKESPKILGHSKKIAQEPAEVEVDYSGGGLQTKTVTLYTILQPNSLCRFGNAQDDSYSLCHNSVDGSDLYYFAVDNSETITIGQYYYPVPTGDDYWIFRGYILLDTSSIPVNANITSATLKIYILAFTSIDTNFYVIIQDGQPDYPHNPVVASDYDCLKYGNNGGQLNTSTISGGGYYNIPLTSNGINWINKGGITKFCLRSSKDIAGIAPPQDEDNYIEIDQMENAIKLTITYTI